MEAMEAMEDKEDRERWSSGRHYQSTHRIGSPSFTRSRLYGRHAKSRDRHDRRLREIFKIWGNLGGNLKFQMGKFLISPFL